jgi:hypothetical protein
MGSINYTPEAHHGVYFQQKSGGMEKAGTAGGWASIPRNAEVRWVATGDWRCSGSWFGWDTNTSLTRPFQTINSANKHW